MRLEHIQSQSYYPLEPDHENAEDLSRRLVINCSGVCIMDTPFVSYKPHGRNDYYLMYVLEGALKAQSGEKQFELHPADVVIYPPHTLYRYQMPPGEKLVYLWAHFTGAEAQRVLKDRQLETATVYRAEDTNAIWDEFERIHHLFVTTPAFFIEEAAARLEILLTHIARAVSGPMGRRAERLKTSLGYLNSHYASRISLETLAAMEYLSPSRYSAIFRQLMGESPQRYLIGLRLKIARELLINTDLSVTEIARSVGYEDALYFSRLFRHYYGYAPSLER